MGCIVNGGSWDYAYTCAHSACTCTLYYTNVFVWTWVAPLSSLLAVAELKSPSHACSSSNSESQLPGNMCMYTCTVHAHVLVDMYV